MNDDEMLAERDAIIAQLRAELAAALKNVDWSRMDSPPCFICGYNGPGYYQPDRHACARHYHAAKDNSKP